MIVDTIRNAFENTWPMLTIFLVVVITIRIAYLRNSNKEFVFYKEILYLVFIIYVLLLFELVTNNEREVSGMNLIPFTEMFRYNINSELFYFNVIGNILVFIPFGYFVSSYVNIKKIRHIILITFITSLTIELVQYRIGRTFDIDDIILNVTGGILGFLLYISLLAIKKHLPSFLQKDLVYNIITIVLIILIISYFIGFGFLR